jgi:hypothetical protein
MVGFLSHRGDAETRRRAEKTRISQWVASVGSVAAVDSRRRRARENARAEIQEAWDARTSCISALVFSRVGRKAANDVDGCPCPRGENFYGTRKQLSMAVLLPVVVRTMISNLKIPEPSTAEGTLKDVRVRGRSMATLLVPPPSTKT